ncbi:MAG: putative maltokinase [Chthoniobacteraceae bacterium]
MDSITLPISGADVFSPSGLRILEEAALPKYVQRARWFGGKAREPRSFRIQEMIRVSGDADGMCGLALLAVEYGDGAGETYSLPLEVTDPGRETERVEREFPGSILARTSDGCVVFDAVHGECFRAALLRLLATGEEIAATSGSVVGTRGSAMPPNAADGLPSKVLRVEQSNSSIIYSEPAGEAGEAGVLFVKLFRKLEHGINPDVEITRFLAEERGFSHVPPFGGIVEYRQGAGEPQVLALALGLVPNEGDAWSYALKEVRRFYERVLEAGVGGEAPAPITLFGNGEPSSVLRKMIGDFYPRVEQLGTRTGEMHAALGSDASQAEFAPEPFSEADQRALGESLTASIERLTDSMSTGAHPVGTGTNRLVSDLIARRDQLLERARDIASTPISTEKIRTHGDYHLGQVLNTGTDFVIIDFEGEPQRSLAERREKRSPLRDVAGMLRSFHYAAHSDLEEFPEERAALEAWAEAWSAACSQAFLRAWLRATEGASFRPHSAEETQRLLDAFLLEKAIYEVGYELNNRPTWLPIPLRGILRLIGAGTD